MRPRRVCYRCLKPRVTCVCRNVPRVSNKTEVFILQHPRERLHPIGTARIALLGLENVRIEVAWNAGICESERPTWLPQDAALIYPSKSARDLSAVAPADRPKALIILDGTWHTAKTLYRDKTWLHALPHYRFAPSAPSRYRIRREPTEYCVSSIEAIVAALTRLEPETDGFEALLDAFDAMIDEQIAYMRARETAPRKPERRRPLGLRRMPRALAEDFERLVLAYGESSRPNAREPRALVQWTAMALATGETFDCRIRAPFGLPPPEHRVHMKLGEEDFVDAVDEMTFRHEWRHFLDRCGKNPIVAAWNQSTLDLLASVVGGPPSRTALKSAYRTVCGPGSGSLDDVVAGQRIATVPLAFRGRAAVRMANLVAVARRMHSRCSGAPAPDTGFA